MDPSYPPPPAPPAQTLHLSPRRELQLQGPRPSPLRVSKDSHKIKKPPPAPAPGAPAAPPPQQQQRDPVIIYTVSPKIIHVDPSNFMDVVQRLTGSTADESAAPPAAAASGEGLSPAAKMATIQKTIQSSSVTEGLVNALDQLEMDGGTEVERPASIPGILSPAPASLPPTSPVFFSPSSDPSFLSFLQDLSPAGFQVTRPSPGAAAAGGGGGGGSGSFFGGPGSFFSPSFLPSPGAAAWDLFNQLNDF